MTTMAGPHTDTQPPTGNSWTQSTTEWGFTNGLSRNRNIDDMRLLLKVPGTAYYRISERWWLRIAKARRWQPSVMMMCTKYI